MSDTAERQQILSGLDDQQLEAVTTTRSPLLVVAGAGSGKTRVLSRRIAWRATDDEAFAPHALALTFTRRAAAELRVRLQALGLSGPVTAGTFHAVALAELRRRAMDAGKPSPVVVDAKLRLVSEAMSRLRSGGLGRDQAVRVAAEIDWAKARRIAPEHYEEAAERARRGGTDRDEVALAYRAYELEKRRRGVLDLDDVLERLIEAMESDVDFAATQGWRFRHFFVDELQDANPAQLALLDCWLGGRPDLFGVGDPRQSIYGWNGSDPAAVTAFATRYPGAAVIELDANYRSTPEIVAVASSVLDPPPLAPTSRPSGPVPTLTAYLDAQAEARGIATAIGRLHRDGRPFHQIAVLSRTNAQLSLIEEALLGETVPVRARDGTAFLSRSVVRDALRAVRQASDPTRFSLWAGELGADRDNPRSQGAAVAADRRELTELAELAAQYRDLDPAPNGRGFVEFLNASAAEGAAGTDAGVALLTFHRAKGLEWQVVFVTGLEVGLVPISQARTHEQQAEERRLAYVAMSRAADELHLSWAAGRGPSNGRGARAPSPYLLAVEVARSQLTNALEPAGSSVSRALADSRAALRRSIAPSASDRERALRRRTVDMDERAATTDVVPEPTRAQK